MRDRLAHCERCNRERLFKHYNTKQRRPCLFCSACGWRVHPRVGTIYERSSTPMEKWDRAHELVADGISARRLSAELKVQYKTAWRMKRLILERADES